MERIGKSAKQILKSKREFWIAKIERNMIRDQEVSMRLKADGWTVFRFWGKEIAKNTEYYAKKIQEAAHEKQDSLGNN